MSSNDPIDPRDVDPLEQEKTVDADLQEVTAADLSPADRLRSPSETADQEEPEEDAWEGGYSGKAMFGNWLVAGFVSLLVIVLLFRYEQLREGDRSKYILLGIASVWILLGFMVLYRKMNVRYHLTTQRFIHQSGILTRVSDRIEVIDIDDVTYYQGVIERLVGVGSIKVNSSDRTHPELWLRGIENVQEVADLLDDLRRKERRRRGLHIESI
jgi:membrane protein YdbS with pleckstrin-like domain